MVLFHTSCIVMCVYVETNRVWTGAGFVVLGLSESESWSELRSVFHILCSGDCSEAELHLVGQTLAIPTVRGFNREVGRVR